MPTRTKAKRPARAASKAPKAAKKLASKPRRSPAAAARRTAGPRADYGAPIQEYLGKQPPGPRALLDALRALVAEAAPDASAALKWGIPWFTVGGETFCGLAGFRSHVNLILPGVPGTFADPGGLLQGEGKTGKHLKLRPGAEVPRGAIRGWLRTAVRAARTRAGI